MSHYVQLGEDNKPKIYASMCWISSSNCW